MIVATTLVTYDKPSCLTVEKKSVVWRKKKKGSWFSWSTPCSVMLPSWLLVF